jgi:hypothetical protein
MKSNMATTIFISVADLDGAAPPPPFSPKVYHLILVKLKISDQKYQNFLLFSRGGPPLRSTPLLEISGSASAYDLFLSPIVMLNKVLGLTTIVYVSTFNNMVILFFSIKSLHLVLIILMKTVCV